MRNAFVVLLMPHASRPRCTKKVDRLVIIASKGGAPTHPAWCHNLVASPIVTVELPGETFRTKAPVAEGEQRGRLFAQQAAQMPGFAEYQRNTTRRIPIVPLTGLSSEPVREGVGALE